MAEEKSAARRLEMIAAPLVAVPACAPGSGLGHLRRAILILSAAGARGFLCVGKPILDARPEVSSLCRAVDPKRFITDPASIPDGALVVLDYRRTPRDLWASLAARTFVLGVDEGGTRRPYFHYLLDTLPMLIRREHPNTSALPAPRPDGPAREARPPFLKALVSFGGEDAAGLSRRLLSALIAGKYFSPSQITVIEGPLFRPGDWPAGMTVKRDGRGVDEVIDGYDLLFTHYGLAAYEALLRGVPVILFNPSGYHRRLSRADGIPEIGVGVPDGRRLARWLSRPEALLSAADGFRQRQAEKRDLPPLIAGLSPQGSPGCPVCGGPGGRALERFPLKTYFRCPGCGIIRLVFWGGRKIYDNNYFNREYRQQYGRTYLEDFDKIRLLGEGRLDRIAALTEKPNARGTMRGLTLLDVGAAYGPFLAAARDRGLTATGLEIAEEAASHARRLGLDCLCGNFENEPPGVRLREKSFDIITMWYVLEHFIPAGEILRKVNRLLKPGGVFAFATPSGNGVSYRKNRRAFLEESPADHFTVWSPQTAVSALGRFGLRVKKTVVTGHHPERFGGGGGVKSRRRLLGVVSRLFGLGDTFEAYAIKEREID